MIRSHCLLAMVLCAQLLLSSTNSLLNMLSLPGTFAHVQIRVFADHVVESSEVTTGVTKLGDFELHDLVLLE